MQQVVVIVAANFLGWDTEPTKLYPGDIRGAGWQQAQLYVFGNSELALLLAGSDQAISLLGIAPCNTNLTGKAGKELDKFIGEDAFGCA